MRWIVLTLLAVHAAALSDVPLPLPRQVQRLLMFSKRTFSCDCSISFTMPQRAMSPKPVQYVSMRWMRSMVGMLECCYLKPWQVTVILLCACWVTQVQRSVPMASMILRRGGTPPASWRALLEPLQRKVRRALSAVADCFDVALIHAPNVGSVMLKRAQGNPQTCAIHSRSSVSSS